MDPSHPTSPQGPLSGIRVIDFGQVYQGPYATFLMARAGAEIVKVEPLEGESARQRAALNKGASFPFEMLNANKRSITLNLKTEAGRQLLFDLVQSSDVLLENFAPGVMDRLGVGWEVLRKLRPSLIYASGTGYGLSGPDRDNLAMDLTIQAASGVMASTGFPGDPPLRAGPAIADFMGGVNLYAGVVTALFERERTGLGRLVEIAMIETIYPTLASTLGLIYEVGEGASTRTGNRHGGLAIAPYNVYPALDGHVAIICPVESHWRNLTQAMGREDLQSDPRFATNAARVARIDEVDALVGIWSSTRLREDLFRIGKAFKAPIAPVREVFEVMHDEHMHSRGMLQSIDHPRLGPVVMSDSPIRLHGALRGPLTPAPDLGVDNDEVFGTWLGRSSAELAALRADGVI